MLNLKFLRELHVILKDITIFLCVALPVVYCLGLAILIYTVDNEYGLVSYYAIKVIASVSVVTSLCLLMTIGLGLYLKERR